jgi:hypothetical protein
MVRSTLQVAQLGQDTRHALMCFSMAGLQTQSRLEMFTRRCEIATLHQRIGQIDPAHRVVRMPGHGFGERGARRGPVSGPVEQGAEVVQRTPMGGVTGKHIEIRVSGPRRCGRPRTEGTRAQTAEGWTGDLPRLVHPVPRCVFPSTFWLSNTPARELRGTGRSPYPFHLCANCANCAHCAKNAAD